MKPAKLEQIENAETLRKQAELYRIIIALHDGGYSFEHIGERLRCEPEFARKVCIENFLEDAAAHHELRH